MFKEATRHWHHSSPRKKKKEYTQHGCASHCCNILFVPLSVWCSSAGRTYPLRTDNDFTLCLRGQSALASQFTTQKKDAHSMLFPFASGGAKNTRCNTHQGQPFLSRNHRNFFIWSWRRWHVASFPREAECTDADVKISCCCWPSVRSYLWRSHHATPHHSMFFPFLQFFHFSFFHFFIFYMFSSLPFFF